MNKLFQQHLLSFQINLTISRMEQHKVGEAVVQIPMYQQTSLQVAQRVLMTIILGLLPMEEVVLEANSL